MAFQDSDQPPQKDRRKTHRYAVSGPRQQARLQIGKLEIVAELRDESAGGYGVVLEEALDCPVGTIGILKAAGGWTEVRIIYLQLLTSPAAAGTVSKARTRLGLMRLRTLEESDAQTVDATEPSLLSLATFGSLAKSFAGSLFTKPGAIVGGILMGTLLSYGIWRSLPDIPVSDGKKKAPVAQPEFTLPAAKPAVAKKQPTKPEPASTEADAVPEVKTSANQPGPVSPEPAESAPIAGPAAAAKAVRASRSNEFRAVIENPRIKELPGLSREQLRRLREWAAEIRATAGSAAAAITADSRLEFLTEEQQSDLERALLPAVPSTAPATPANPPIQPAAE